MDDWEAKYWKQKAQQKQHQHSAPVAPAPPPPPTRDVEINAADIMAQRMMGGLLGGQQQQQGNSAVYLREGATYYRQIHNPDGFGTTMPLVRSMGPLTQVTGKMFTTKGDLKGYCIDDLPSVDLSKANDHPERMLQLVRVSAPFVGDILVPRTAVIEANQNPGGKQLLRG